jgi:capsular exopolysaccharide synthesis family protein
MDQFTENIHEQEQSAIDIQKFIFKVIRKWYWFVISVSIAYCIAYLKNHYSDSVYSVNATLVINDEKKTTAEQIMSAFDRYSTRKVIENEIATLRSFQMTYRTIKELEDFEINYYAVGRVRKTLLYKSTPFRVITDSAGYLAKGAPVNITILNKTEYKIEIEGDHDIKKTQKFGEPYNANGFAFTLFLKDPQNYVPGPTSKYIFVVNDINSYVNEYRNKINISSTDKRGSILNLSITGLCAEKEVDYLNKLMEVYIRNGLEEKNQTSINTINFIDEQLGTIHDSLKKAEDKLQGFKEKNNVLDMSSEGTSLMTQLTNLQTTRANIEMQLRYYKYLQEYIERKKDFREVMAPAVIGISDPLLNSLVNNVVELYAERSELKLNVQQNFPSVGQLEAKIKNSIEALQENIRQNIATSNLSMKGISEQQAKLEDQIRQLPVTERKLLTIERDFKINEQVYNFLLQRRADAAIAKASNVADNRVLDAATLFNSYQIAPTPGKNTMMAVILGLILPLVIILLSEFFNNRIMEPKDVERATHIPVVGTIGHNEDKSEIPVSDNPQSAISESFRGLRTNLQYIIRKKGARVICISSTISGEGKTFSTVNLAAIIAQSNRKTLLMSLDLRKPQIHKIFNASNDIGLSTYLIGRSSYREVITQTNINNLYIATSGPIPPNPAELIETQAMEDFIEKAKEEFDTIILDTPPVAIVTDAVLLSRFADTFLYVIRQGYSQKSVIGFIEDLQNKHEITNLGIIINDVLVPNYYGYRYAYGYGYGYTYSTYYGESPQKKYKKNLLDRFLS